MSHDAVRHPPSFLPERARRVIIWAIIIVVPWAPAAVALAMILSGNVGP